MEQDHLKSAWKGVATGSTSQQELQAMKLERTHPVLKSIRKQLIIEITAFTAFLIVYYDFFDGDKRPWWANALLVAAMSVVIIHNVIGYGFTKRGVKGNNIRQTLEHQIGNMKTYAVASIIGRTLMTVCLLIFFSSIITFTTIKYWILLGIAVTVIIQLSVLSRIWIKRIRQMKLVLDSFGNE